MNIRRQSEELSFRNLMLLIYAVLCRAPGSVWPTKPFRISSMQRHAITITAHGAPLP